MSKEDNIELEGVVTHALPSATFKVMTDQGLEVTATVSGKIRINHIRVLVGDQVTIEVSPYDLTRGRITFRGEKKKKKKDKDED